MKTSIAWLRSVPAFFWLIALAITIALILVTVSMWLYMQGDAARVDLSRPDYQAVRKHAQKTDSFEGFSVQQSLSSDAMAEFDRLMGQKMQEVESYKESFHGAPLSNEELEITAQ